jgi:hypothetical protein
MFWML